jgi:hypothetical protein
VADSSNIGQSFQDSRTYVYDEFSHIHREYLTTATHSYPLASTRNSE